MLKYELKKIYREKTTYILSLLLLVIIALPFVIRSTPFDYLNYYEKNYQANITTIDTIKNDPTAAETVSDITESNSYLKELIESIKAEDSDAMVRNELTHEKKNLEDMEAGKLRAGPLIDKKLVIAVLENLENNNLQKKSNDTRKLEGIQYLILIFSSQQLMLIVLILICFQIAYTFTLDYRKNNFIVYCVSPNSYLKTYFTKLLTSIVVTVISSFSAFLIVFAMISVKNGIGTLSYPISIIENNVDVAIITSGDFLAKIIVFLLLFVILLNIVGLLLSIISGNQFLNISLLIFPLIFGQYELMNTFVSDELMPRLLLSYVDIAHIISGGSSMKPLPNPLLTYQSGMILLLINTMVFLVFTIGVLLIPSQKLMIHKLKK